MSIKNNLVAALFLMSFTLKAPAAIHRDFSPKPNDVALLIVGDSDQDLFSKSVTLAYTTLRDIGLPDDHIHVVAAKPHDLNQDGQPDKTFEPNPAGIVDALQSLAEKKQSDSNLIVYIKAHGENVEGDFQVALSIEPHEVIKAGLLGTLIDLLGFARTQQLIIIDSCYSGLAIAALKSPRRWIVTSTDAAHESWTHLATNLGSIENPDEPQQQTLGYSIFSYDFLNALNTSDPLKIRSMFDLDLSGQLSVIEAYQFLRLRRQTLVLTIKNRAGTYARMKKHFFGMDVFVSPDTTKCTAVLKNFPQLSAPAKKKTLN